MGTIRIGVVGQYQSGKSLLINCLLRRHVASVGKGVPTTHTIVNYIYSSDEYVEFTDGLGLTSIQPINSILLGIDNNNEICNPHLLGIADSHNEWGRTSDATFEIHHGDWLVLRGYNITANGEFKLRANNNCDINYGANCDSESLLISEHQTYTMIPNGKNLSVSSAGSYDVYFNKKTHELFINRTENTPMIKIVNVYLNNPLLANFELVDMPGFGNDNYDNSLAFEALKNIDYAIVVASNYKTIGVNSPVFNDFCLLQQYNIPYYFFLNCTDFLVADKWMPSSTINCDIVNDYFRLTSFYKPINFTTNEDKMPIVNLMWYWYSISDDNNEVLQRRNIQNAIKIHQLKEFKKKDIQEYSQFEMIKNLFSMDNKMYLELKRELKEEIAKFKEEVCPVGTIQAFAFNRIPKGWVICDGRSLDPKVHSDLFHAIGTTFGGNGETSFCLPDLRGNFIRGWSADGDNDSDRRFGSFQNDAIQEHAHTAVYNNDETEYGGEHCHNVKYKKTTYGYGGLTSLTYEMMEITSDDYLSWVYSTEAVKANGQHNHKLPQISIQDVKSTNQHTVKTAKESRPKNVALLYCIKVGLQDK